MSFNNYLQWMIDNGHPIVLVPAQKKLELRLGEDVVSVKVGDILKIGVVYA